MSFAGRMVSPGPAFPSSSHGLAWRLVLVLCHESAVKQRDTAVWP